MTRRIPLGLWWALLAVVLAVALGIGSVKPSPPPSNAQRVAAIDSVVRCPSCEGVSVAQSSAPAAVAIRTAVAARVAAGQSDAAIEAFLVDRYGEGILLRPAAGGGIGLVWLLPVLALAAGIGALGVVFWRRRTTPAPAVAEEDRSLVASLLAERRGSS